MWLPDWTFDEFLGSVSDLLSTSFFIGWFLFTVALTIAPAVLDLIRGASSPEGED